jgi:acetoin utilization protein AcuB
MFAIQFVSQEMFPLKRSDTAENALLFMEDWQVKELPVVELGKVIGYVTYAITAERENERVEHFMLPPQPFVISAKLHLFDIWNHMANTGFTALALQNSEGNYEGMLRGREMAMQAFAHSALVQEGAVLVLEIEAIHYSLAEITRICETNEAKIIHLMVEPLKNEANILQVSIKLNKAYPAHVMASLERFGYKVIFSNGAEDPNHSLEDRYRWLVKYLNT